MARNAKFFQQFCKKRFCGFLVLLNLRAQFLKEFTFEGLISYKRVSYKKITVNEADAKQMGNESKHGIAAGRGYEKTLKISKAIKNFKLRN